MTNKSKKRISLKCAKCERSIAKTHEKIQCAGQCHGWYHKHCTDLTEDEYKRNEKKIGEKWVCDGCLDESESESESEVDSEEEIPEKNTQQKKKSKNVKKTCSEDIFDDPQPTNKQLLNALKEMFEDMKKSVSFNGTMIEDLKTTIKKVMDENKVLKREQAALKNRVADLEQEIIEMKSTASNEDSVERSKNIVVVGLKGGQNIKKDVKKVFGYLKLDIPDQDYEVKTLAGRNEEETVLVTFAQKSSRDMVLQEKKTIRLDTTACGITTGNATKIFLNEDLSKYTRDLFKKARELRRHGYKYVWCKNGNIFSRKNDNSRVQKILTSSQVNQLMGIV